MAWICVWDPDCNSFLYFIKMFGNRTKILQDYFDKEIRDMRARVGNLEIEIEKLKTHINSLRGLINRKVFKDTEPGKTEELKSIDGLDLLRK